MRQLSCPLSDLLVASGFWDALESCAASGDVEGVGQRI